jgi:hypothetical protein
VCLQKSLSTNRLKQSSGEQNPGLVIARGAGPDLAAGKRCPHDCHSSPAASPLAIGLAAEAIAGVGRAGHAADDRLCKADVSAETRPLAPVAERSTDTTMLPTRAMPAQHPYRVNLIERQQDQNETAAVSSARA